MKSLSILYVEDNDELRDAMGELMEGDGREVVACGSGEQALVELAARDFDVLITDISLPGLSGTDLARQALASRQDRWVVLCSGYDVRHGLSSLGPNVRSLAKPFELEDLDALLDEIHRSLG